MKEHQLVTAYKKNYRTQINSLNQFTSFVVEFLNKTNLSAEQTKRFLDEFGNLRACLLGRGRDNRNLYFRAASHIDELRKALKKSIDRE